MPYITKGQHGYIDKVVDQLFMWVKSKGEYNYVITRLLHQFIIDYYAKFDHQERYGLCYDALNDAIGILECAKQELYRAVAGPYEDQKRKENGNISILDKQ